MDIVNGEREGAGALRAELVALEGNMFRLKINEKNPLRPRYEVQDALVGEPATLRCICYNTLGCTHVYTLVAREMKAA